MQSEKKQAMLPYMFIKINRHSNTFPILTTLNSFKFVENQFSRFSWIQSNYEIKIE